MSAEPRFSESRLATDAANLMRQLDGYFRSLADFALNVNAPAVVADDFMNNGQSQTRAARLARKRLKQIFEILGTDAAARVFKNDLNVFAGKLV